MTKQMTNHNYPQLLYSVFVFCILLITIWFVSGYIPKTNASETPQSVAPMTVEAVDANPGSLGPIPDNQAPAGINVTFTVNNIPPGEKVTNVSLEMTMDHSWVGDVSASLSAPPAFGNTHIIFQEIGDFTGNAGVDSSNFDGTYTFNDAATGDIWDVAINQTNSTTAVAPGAYRTSAPLTGNFTIMNDAFSSIVAPLSDNPLFVKKPEKKGGFDGMPSNLANGTWTLLVTDNQPMDTGNITGARLTITTLPTLAASATIAGRVLNSRGRGLRFVTVMLTGNSLLEPLYATTNMFGRYQFEDIPVGDTYVLQVFSKRYEFNQNSKVINLDDNITDADFIGGER